MTEDNNTENAEVSLEEIVSAGERLTPLLTMFMGPKSLETEHAALIKRRKQIGSYTLIASIVVVVTILAYLGSIDPGAAACILGTITGHIFCSANNG